MSTNSGPRGSSYRLSGQASLRREVLFGLHEQVLNQLAFIELCIDMQFFTKNVYTRSGERPVDDFYTDVLRKFAGAEIKRKTCLVAFKHSHICLVSKTPFRRSGGSLIGFEAVVMTSDRGTGKEGAEDRFLVGGRMLMRRHGMTESRRARLMLVGRILRRRWDRRALIMMAAFDYLEYRPPELSFSDESL